MKQFRYFILLMTLNSIAFFLSADIYIPDINLRQGITKALNIPTNTAITHDHLLTLTQLEVPHQDIQELTGLQYASNLTALNLSYNNITDISEVAYLRQLKYFHAVSNKIKDVTPLANLENLRFLDLHDNQVVDHSVLDHLVLDHFTYDQTCDMPRRPVIPRVKERNFPSVFARWSWLNDAGPIMNLPLKQAHNMAKHDLWFSIYPLGLRLINIPGGFKVVGDVERATKLRDEIHKINPNNILLLDIRMGADGLDRRGEDWPGWVREPNGEVFRGYVNTTIGDYGIIDFTKPFVQDLIVQEAIAIAKCGLYDGIMFDYWSDQWRVIVGWDGTQHHFFYSLEDERKARLNIVRRIREHTDPDFLIMGNTNYAIIPVTGEYLNGGFMETGIPEDLIGADLERVINATEFALSWLDNNLREPRINGLEGFSIPGEALDSPNNLRWVRALTTLSLTHSDGYVLYSETKKFGHYWYDFWDADLGRPVGEKGEVYEGREGLYIREFTNGWAVYNHSGSPQVIRLPEEVQGVASGLVNVEHALPNLDGEMYLRVKSVNPADVNGDGVVNLFDLTLVAQAISMGDGERDVNGDGVVNVFDLVQVAGAIGGGGAAPSAYSPDLSIISAADVAKWLALAQRLGVGDANFQRGIRFLEGLLAALKPKETALLPNYPNPFNPETWIPYRLAREAEVAITIYDTKGTLVRRLALGNQSAGHYAERGKAAYWDGRNERGEAVASGIYVYQFRARDYAASRRMVIVK